MDYVSQIFRKGGGCGPDSGGMISKENMPRIKCTPSATGGNSEIAGENIQIQLKQNDG